MSPVRAAVLASLRPAAGVNTNAFVVPAGQTYIQKNLAVYNVGPGNDTINVWAQDAAGIQVFFWAGLIIGPGARVETSETFHFGPGHSLQINSLTGNSSLWSSGAKLPGVGIVLKYHLDNFCNDVPTWKRPWTAPSGTGRRSAGGQRSP